MKLRSKPDYKPKKMYVKMLTLVGLAIVLTVILTIFFSIRRSSAPDGDGVSQIEQPTHKTQQNDTGAGYYPLHTNIIATIFWTGEGADDSNDYIHNRSSAWVEDWIKSFGGIDNPDSRCGYRPCSFVPNENAFYFALPFSDYNDAGLKSASELAKVPWYNGDAKTGDSILKNRWVEISHANKKAYAQWEDVGPFGENDADYVFGSNAPSEIRAGIDLSPSTADYLGIDGRGYVDWRFVDFANVPDGPWKATITISKPQH